MKPVYLDNSATTALSEAAKAAMREAMEAYANPSSLHTPGTEARALVEDARKKILAAAGIRKGWRLVFTGSGSEANNLAIAGFVFAGKHVSARRILTTDSEHPSVEKTAERMRSVGYVHVKIPTRGGALDLAVLEEELKKGAALVSLMLVNNETGALYDYAKAAELTRRYAPEALLHCDAVQGFLRVPLPLDCADMISVSAHKIHGPKGCGALFVREELFTRKCLSPVISGGEQEWGLRGGTENTVCIAGFGAAADEARRNYAADSARLDALYRFASEKLTMVGCRVNVPQNAVSHILSVTLPGIKSQTMLSFLSAVGVCVSAGSACSSKDRHISRALSAFGLSDDDADATIRVSLCAQNTEEEIDVLCGALRDGIKRLIKFKK